ncbi:hypothetical protein HMP0721_2342 [Pseudoramibacter alactolyticus ATCC 23263]|uniref:Uncharacterized protein n=1 Tax=Pseudoramibacter alactolyticus ATCC 23263 TaxID=887929 RepID=E6MK07_9FIRM|nr:hypothetical protein HMP0721_2342 [Pseudoramibacter alactolyticus ATCC 23263]
MQIFLCTLYAFMKTFIIISFLSIIILFLLYYEKYFFLTVKT